MYWLKTFIRVRWSPSGTVKRAFAASASRRWSFGRSQTLGTAKQTSVTRLQLLKMRYLPESIAVIVRISLLHLNSGLTINNFASYGREISLVKARFIGFVKKRNLPEDQEENQPSLLPAELSCHHHQALRGSSAAQGHALVSLVQEHRRSRKISNPVIKLVSLNTQNRKTTRTLTPSFKSWRTVVLKSPLRISGCVWSSSSLTKYLSVYNLKHLPGLVRPALPARC